jgi:hypothetical protein
MLLAELEAMESSGGNGRCTYHEEITTGLATAVGQLGVMKLLLVAVFLTSISTGGYNVWLGMQHVKDMAQAREALRLHVEEPGHKDMVDKHEGGYH